MKKIFFLSITAITFIAIFTVSATNKYGGKRTKSQQQQQQQYQTISNADKPIPNIQDDNEPINIKKNNDNPSNGVIQIALLLDVSGSMQGLLNQARTQLWNVVNTVSKAKLNNQEAKLEIGIFEYGNNEANSDYITKKLDFTGDLDKVSEILFNLQITGSEEYCGTVIKQSLQELMWQLNTNNYNTIIIAGNEPFTQGQTSYQRVCKLAAEHKIIVNTIHCGTEKEGINGNWRDGATAGNGKFFCINSNTVHQYKATPYDSLIDLKNNALNDTYWGYGTKGNEGKSNQSIQDINNSSITKEAYYSRAKTKANSGNYAGNTVSWDITTKVITDSTYLYTAKETELPTQLKGKSLEQKKQIIADNNRSRKIIEKEITELIVKRETYIQSNSTNNKNEEGNLGNAISEAIKLQASARGFNFN
jgi:hypothetical protein